MSASSLHLVVWTLPRTPPRTKSNHRHQGLHHSTGRVGVFSRKSCSTVCTLDQGVLGPSIQRSGGVVEGSRAASWLNGRKEARNNISESFVFGDPKKAWTGVVPVSFSIIHAVPAGDELLLIGSTKELGSWDADQALHMRRTEGNIWTASTSLPYEKFEFKVALKLANGRVHWQPTAGNAVLDVAALKTVTRDSVVGVKLSWSTTLVDVKLLRVRIAKRDPGAIESPEAKVERLFPIPTVSTLPRITVAEDSFTLLKSMAEQENKTIMEMANECVRFYARVHIMTTSRDGK